MIDPTGGIPEVAADPLFPSFPSVQDLVAAIGRAVLFVPFVVAYRFQFQQEFPLQGPRDSRF